VDDIQAMRLSPVPALDPPSCRVLNVLAISGSLRAVSNNSALLRAAARLAPPGISVRVFPSLGGLPLFNPDLEPDAPNAVADFRARVADADAIIIASPEYAHGVTGAIKNALDWLVSFEPFAHKPVAVLNASPRAHHADAALRETLKTMAALIVEPASITIPILGSHLDEDGMVSDASIAPRIQAALQALDSAVRTMDM
jgi:chromate reductase